MRAWKNMKRRKVRKSLINTKGETKKNLVEIEC